ncbi:MAG: MFS transporter [Bacteroidales bacterium]|jgi:POT family proton-dependent oligopeptide transporter|nr:MFS transporter [Bacteroidales bacterium]MDI9592589.1 MFS transporter [Bacteroidota bacterium]HOF80839.1 MFS transporter [Bacteroidales bacterium]HOR76192.1 MFS transporter [Bacteroidales bacterium]
MNRVSRVLKAFPKNFWTANTMELLERWAWYGMFMLFALYLTGSKDSGALGFSQEQKGYLMGPVVAILYFLPVITGALADRYGYRKILIIAYIILASGYFMMSFIKNYTSLYIVFIYVAVGAALFKPVISATIAKTTNSETSSIGFGIFYMMVNIGAFIGPVVASKLRGIDWQYVFITSSVVSLVNLFIVLFFFKEPLIEKSTIPLFKSIITIFKNIGSALSDLRLLLFLLIITGFWAMYNQLFYTLPVFIDQWMDTSLLYQAIFRISPSFARAVGTNSGTIAPEMLTNLDALYIIMFQIFVSAFVMRYKALNAMISGILVNSIGLGLTFYTNNPFFLFVSILIFGLGEMASSPKITEYIGRIAPEGKVALYMGASFLPMAGGNFFAGILSGNVYGNMSDKITLLQKEIALRGLDVPAISDTFTQNDLLTHSAELMNMTQNQLTEYLWTTYSPGNIWIVFAGIGIGTSLLLFLYDKFLLSTKGNNS